MIILNTTFVVHESVKDEFMCWLRSEYLPKAADAGFFSEPVVAKVLTRVAPDTDSYAVQMICSTYRQAERWHNVDAAGLREELHNRLGEKMVFFTTYMEQIEV